MIHVVLNVFEEVTNLPRAVMSIERLFEDPQFVFIDGAYPDYESPNRLSKDGTQEYALGVGHLIHAPDTPEVEKRNLGLHYIDCQAHEGDWVLVLDADEELTQRISWPDRVGSFSFTRGSRPEIQYGRCRLYRWEPGLHFKHRHYDLYGSDEILVSSLEDAPDFQMIGFGIHHDNSHDKAREDTKRLYYRELRKHEGHPSERVPC